MVTPPPRGRDEKVVFIDDQYCVSSGRNCKGVSLTFLEAEDREVNILGMLSVDIVKWKIENSEPKKLTDRELRALLKEFKKDYCSIHYSRCDPNRYNRYLPA